MNSEKTFAAVINCMDGRVQVPVNKFMIEKYIVDYLDTITEVGPNKILAEQTDIVTVNSIKNRFDVSTIKHNSKVVAMVGHYDCGGNPAEKDEQIVQIRKSAELIRSWNANIEVIELWVDKKWVVNEL